MNKHNTSFIKKIIIYLLVSGVLLGVACIFVYPMGKTLDIYATHLSDSPYSSVTVKFKKEGIAECTYVKENADTIHIRYKGLKPGTVYSTLDCEKTWDDGSTTHDVQSFSISVTKSLFLYSNGEFNFNGYQFIFLAVTIFYITFGIYTFVLYRRSKKAAFFSYHTIISLGLSMYYMLQGLALLPFSTYALFNPEKMNGLYFFTFNSFVLTAISLLSTPFLLIFSLLMSISNFTLIKREGKRLSNLLGIIISFLLLSGVILVLIQFIFFSDEAFEYLKVSPKHMAEALTRGIVSSVFVYFECNLLVTLILALKAGRHKPKFDKDYLIILGCGIKKDGTLYPLLRGRVDRAIAFYKAQLEATGKKAFFVPSGGQGDDEIMAEGEAMKRYLISQGIPEEQILPETRSLNTLQNMAYSKEIIDSKSENASIAFSTTNYHVFRGGMLAASVGMNADGMGAKTKWYFWPNALIREFVGMLVTERKIHILLLLIIVMQAIMMGNIQFILKLL